jgi:hypothetical protein
MTTQPPSPAVTTRTAEVRLDGDVLRARFHDGAEVDLADARENLEACAALVPGRQLGVLVDLRPVRSQTAEARAHFAGPAAGRIASGLALLIGSPLSRVLGNFYLRFNRPGFPTRLFSSEDEALRWLAELAAGRGREAADGGA